MKKALKRTIWIGALIVVLIIGGVVYGQLNRSVPEYSAETVTRGVFIQSVEETGVIDSHVSITYGWESSGRVVEVSKEVGDMVTSTDIIARLDNRNEMNGLRQAQSQLYAAQARLDEMLAEPSEEEQDTYRARIAQAEASLSQAETQLENTQTTVAADIAAAERTVAKARTALQQTDTTSQAVQDAYDNLVNDIDGIVADLNEGLIESDEILGIDNSFANDAYEDVLSAQNTAKLRQAETQYDISKRAVSDAVDSWNATDLTVFAEIDIAASLFRTALVDVNELLSLVLEVLDATPPIGELSQTELNTLQSGITAQKTSILAARNILTTGLQAVNTAKNATQSNEITLADAEAALATAHRTGDQQIASAERTVELRTASLQEANAAYNAFVAGPRDVDIAALRADVSRYVAAVEAAQTAVDDMVLRALADGTITILDIDVGETVTPNQDIVTIQSDDRKIEVDISESDIAKVMVGDEAVVELDAYDDVTFTARVTKIDPAATEISGVVYYKTTLEVDVPDDLDVRPGMTADVQIITEQKEDTISLPRRAVLTREDGSRYVRVLTDAERATYEERTVTVGLSGDDGLVEITSGLSGGEKVITFIEE